MKKTFLTAMLLAMLAFGMIAGCEQLEGPSGQQWAELPPAEEGAAYVGATDDNTPVELVVEGDTYAVTVGGEEVSGGTATKAKDGTWTLQPEGGEPLTAKASAYGLTLDGPITDTLDGEDLHELYPSEAPPDASLTLSLFAIHVFPSANAGDTAQSAKTIAVTNSGNEATGELTVALSGTNSDSFTLNNETIASIAAGKKAAFSVKPNTGLAAGVYTARVTVSGDNGISAGFNVRFTVNNEDGTPDAEDPDDIKPDYGINLSRSEPLVFEEAVAGYPALTPATITISNTGNKATGRLMIDLSGENSGAFTRSPASIASIAADGSATFTIVPKTGQKAGTYAATVTVSGSTGISAGFDAGFEVKPVPVYGVGLSQSGTLAFEEAVFGYDARTPQTITITNKGNQPTGALAITLAGDGAASFTLSRDAIEEGLAPDGEADFTVVPKGGLAAGLHTATVSVSGSNGIFAGLNVSFNVIAETFGIELNVGGAHGFRDAIIGYQALTAQTLDISFPDAIFGYPALTAQTVSVTNKGNQPTGDLAVTLIGDDASAFTASRNTVTGIAVGGSDSFTVAPIDGLEVGTYTAQVSVGNGNVAAQSFEVSFVVETVPEYGISVSQPEEFAKKGEGYAAITPLEITVRNIGNRATGALTAALADEVPGTGAFTLTGAAIGSIAAGGQAVLRAGPRTGLLAGSAGITVYTARVVVSDTGVSGGTGESAVSESVNLKFTVAKNRVVSFNVNGGSPQPVTQTVVHGDLASESAANSVSKANLRFKHWYANGQTATAFNFTAPITADTQFNAAWEADVTFNFNGGTGSAPAQAVAEGGAAVRPIANPLKAGLRFKNWYRNVTDAAAYDFTTLITGHTVLNAVWEADVRFDLNGAPGTPPATHTVTEGGKAAEPATPVWTGYTFGGWYTEAAGTTKWEFGTNTVGAHRVLYAKWTAILRTVTFDSRGGSAVPPVTGIMHGTTIAAPTTPAKANLRLRGWYRNLTDTAAFNFEATPISGNITLLAIWEADVTFNLNGGTGVAAEQAVVEGGVAVKPSANPTKTNLRFKNWYRNTTDTAAFSFTTAITGHTALNAVWEADLTFNLNGATGTALATQVVNEGGKAAAPATDPSRGADWEFDGWYTEAAGTTKWVFDTNTVSANRTLYAKWTRLWAVTLNRNGGTGGQDVYKVRNGAAFTPPAITPPATYTFAGWCKEAALTTAVTSITVTADTPLYAKHSPTGATLFDITFNLNGGFWDEVLDAGVPKSHRAANGTIVNVPTDAPRRLGYAFKGWYYDSALTQAVPKAPSNTVSGYPYRYPVVLSGNTTLYAKWQSMPNVTVSLKAGVMRWCDAGVRSVYDCSVPYGGRLLDVTLYAWAPYETDGVTTERSYPNLGIGPIQASNGNRVALMFPSIDQNRLEYYEYGLSGHDRFYWGDRFYYDQILWGKYKWQSGYHRLDPMPGWDQDYP